MPESSRQKPVHAPPDVDLKRLYRALRLPRTIEEKQLKLIRQGRLSKWFSGYGQEAIAVGTAFALEPEDVIMPLHRNLGVWTTRNVPLDQLYLQLLGKEGGFTRGRDRTFHFGSQSHHIIGMISHLGAMLPVACGIGLAFQLREQSRVVAVFSGEGATREGDFHEAVNLAAVWKLPVIFIIENNLYGLSTPACQVMAVEDIADMGPAYGLRAEKVDGNDVLKVIEAVQRAAASARENEGPALLEMKTFRMRGHEEASGTDYIPDSLIEEWRDRDPLARFVHSLKAQSLMAEDEMHRLDEELAELVEEVAEKALQAPSVNSTPEEELGDLFAPSPGELVPPTGEVQTKRFIDAISDALHLCLELDPEVLLMGQDIAEYGGVFKVTEGFLEDFGAHRIRNTPIIESGILGAALGLALEGFKPVVEMQYADFISCGFNQIVNNLGTTHYRWGAPVNVTIRAPFGGGIGAGPFHSQSPEAWFCHAPGLKVVVPGTPEDAKGLLITAIRDPNPVIFFEHKLLYRSLKGPVHEGVFTIPLGQASRARKGRHATIVTWGVGRLWALEEAEYQASQGFEVEVIDLRTLLPWDQKAVFKSVKKTARVLVLHEAWQTAGFGAEVAATVASQCFQFLDAPVKRLGARHLPVPFSKKIESEVFSARARLRKQLEALLRF